VERQLEPIWDPAVRRTGLTAKPLGEVRTDRVEAVLPYAVDRGRERVGAIVRLLGERVLHDLQRTVEPGRRQRQQAFVAELRQHVELPVVHEAAARQGL